MKRSEIAEFSRFKGDADGAARRAVKTGRVVEKNNVFSVDGD